MCSRNKYGLLDLHKNFDAWIGYNDNEIEGEFLWSDDTTNFTIQNFTNWSVGKLKNVRI